MMNEQNENPINGQSESGDIDLGYDQQGVTEEAQRVADSIVQALDRTDSEGGKWKQRFEKKWGCQVLVGCKQRPLKVALMLLPIEEHPQKRGKRFKFLVKLPEVQNAAGVWPAIEARAERLEELGRFHKYIDWFFEGANIQKGSKRQRQVIDALLCDGPLIDATGFHLYGGHAGYLPWDHETSEGDRYLIDKPLETVLTEWIDHMEKQVVNPRERLKRDLSKIKFTLGEGKYFKRYDCAGLWSVEVDGVSLQGEWVCSTIDGKTIVLVAGHKHHLYINRLSPRLPPGTGSFRLGVEILFELTDQDFNARPGMLRIYEEMRVPPVYRSDDEELDDSTLAGLDYNTNA